MKSPRIPYRLRIAALPVAIAACSEPFAPATPGPRVPEAPRTTAFATCEVDVKARSVVCEDSRPSTSDITGLSANVLLGGQDIYVRVSSSGTSYDAGTDIFRTDLTVQNLLQQVIGSTDGVTVQGLQLFVHSGPTVNSGSGVVTVANADGTATFSGPTQPYFNYNQILEPFELSAKRDWQFNVPETVNTFVFTLLVSAPAPNEGGPYIDRMWNGNTSSAWSEGTNWTGGVPISTSTVAIPPASMVTSGNQPVLSAPVTVMNLRVGAGSTLDLAAQTLTVDNNLDAPGTIANGRVLMSGTGTVLGGTLDEVVITGSTKLQRPTKATGPVTVGGSLSVSNQTLTISIQ